MEAAFQSSFASALLDVLFNRVTNVIAAELKHLKEFDDAKNSLETTLQKARNKLQEVDTSHCQGNIKILMQDKADNLAIFCYETEDLMDDIALTIKKSTFFNILKNPGNWKKPRNINKLQQKLDLILPQLESYEELANRPKSARDLLNGFTDVNLETSLIGRAEDIKAVIQKLSSLPSNRGVSIIGMHGLGKTTLAEAIMKEKEIQDQFLPLWIPVSEGFFNLDQVNHILGGLLDEQDKAKPKAQESSSNNVVFNKRQKVLLIIFDNLLNLSIHAWKRFWSSIRSRKVNGSGIRDKDVKFLITTLNPRIPELTGTTTYYLKRLSNDDCQAVFIENALLNNSNIPLPILLSIAPSIAMKCEGLPLVASILGFVVAQDNINNWVNMDLLHYSTYTEEILPLLRSNYVNMQHKKLLTYFSLFPWDHCFNIDDLVHLWVGEGFIQPPKGTSSLEQIGTNYVNDLLARSILQVSDDVTHSGKPRYELHKSSHDFAKSVASKICQQLNEGASATSLLDNKPRHLSLVCYSQESWGVVMELEGLRTIIYFNDRKNGPIGRFPSNFVKKLRHLRVLVLNGTDVNQLPDSIERLIHLRYLDISYTSIKNLPETLSKLQNLQFLKLKDTKKLLHLPEDFKFLTNLLFVDWDISDIKRLNLPSNIGNLSSLQRLPLFPVGDKDGHFIKELENMNCLQGSIWITNLENVKDKHAAEAATMHKKSALERIELEWMTSQNNIVVQDVLEALKPHDHLKELKITNYGFVMFPSWVSHQLPMLEKIHLQRCRFCNVLPSLGQLPNLKNLVLEEMSSLKHVNREFHQPSSTRIVGSFSSLVLLEFKVLAKLESWTDLKAGDMPRLHTLKIVNCPELSNLPSLEHLSSLALLNIERCQKLISLPKLPNKGGTDWPKVIRVPNVEISCAVI